MPLPSLSLCARSRALARFCKDDDRCTGREEFARPRAEDQRRFGEPAAPGQGWGPCRSDFRRCFPAFACRHRIKGRGAVLLLPLHISVSNNNTLTHTHTKHTHHASLPRKKVRATKTAAAAEAAGQADGSEGELLSPLSFSSLRARPPPLPHGRAPFPRAHPSDLIVNLRPLPAARAFLIDRWSRGGVSSNDAREAITERDQLLA